MRLVSAVMGTVMAGEVRIADAAPGKTIVDLSGATLGFFFTSLFVVIVICVWFSRRAKTADQYTTVKWGCTAGKYGLAIAGDYMSAGAFLGLTATMFGSGLDGFFLAATYLSSWPIVLFLVAEPLRKLEKYSLADVLSMNFRDRPIRVLCSVCSLVIFSYFLIAQLVGAGGVIELMLGVPYRWAVLVSGVVMVICALLRGMRGANWVQIIKAILMLAGSGTMAFLCLSRFNFELSTLLKSASDKHPSGQAIMNIRSFSQDWLGTVSLAIGVLFGTAGLPHILMPFLTVQNERSARISVFYATCLIAVFFLLLLPIGFASISILSDVPGYLSYKVIVMGGSNLIALHIADIVGSDALMGFISAVAFATILAAVSGLLIAGGSSVANDLIKGIFGKTLSARTNLRAFRITVILLGVVAVFLAIVFEGQNVAYMIAMATSVAASANFPLLMLKLYWRRLTTAGVLVGGAFGLVSSVVLIVLGPTVWTKVFGMGPCLFPYDSPAIFTVPATFVVCILVSLYSRRRVVKMVRAVS